MFPIGSPMFEPQFDPQPAWLGLPAGVLLVGVGLLIMGIGSLWAFRMARGDPEPESFWATAKASSRFNGYVKAGLVLAVIAVLATAQMVMSIRNGTADF